MRQLFPRLNHGPAAVRLIDSSHPIISDDVSILEVFGSRYRTRQARCCDCAFETASKCLRRHIRQPEVSAVSSVERYQSYRVSGGRTLECTFINSSTKYSLTNNDSIGSSDGTESCSFTREANFILTSSDHLDINARIGGYEKNFCFQEPHRT